MRAEMLLAKIQAQADLEWDRQWQQRKQEALHPKLTAEVMEDQKLSRICNLRKRTNEIRFQLELDKQLKLEEERNLKATMALREANRTPAERKAQAEETKQFQIRLSRVLSIEHSPAWREQENPNAEVYRQQCTPTHCSKPKNR